MAAIAEQITTSVQSEASRDEIVVPTPLEPTRPVSQRDLELQDLSISILGLIAVFLLRVTASVVATGSIKIEADHLDSPVTLSYLYLSEFLSALICVAVVGTAGRRILIDAFNDIRHLILSFVTLEAAAILSTLIYEVYALFADMDGIRGQGIYHYPVALLAAVLAMRILFKKLNSTISAQTVLSLTDSAPLTRVLKDNVESLVSSPNVRIGETFQVRSGEIIPLDGEVLSGIASLQEKKWSGAAQFRIKGEGQGVLAGSKIESGHLHCRSLSEQADSLYGQFVQNVLNAISRGGEDESYTKLITSLSLLTIFAAACGALFWDGQVDSVEFLPRPFPIGKYGLIAQIISSVLLTGALLRILVLLPRHGSLLLSRLFECGITLRDTNLVQTVASVKNWVFDYESLKAYAPLQVRQFEIIDERIEKRSLVSVLLALLSDSEDESHDAIVQYLRGQIEEPFLFSVISYNSYSKRGIIGTVQGIELTVGTEAFLLERGVELQPSELEYAKEGQSVIYMAMRTALVAKCTLTREARDELKTLFSQMTSRGKRVLLCGLESPEQIDEFGRSLGLELSSIYGGLAGDAYREKIEEWKPVGLYSTAPLRGEIRKHLDISISHFDQLQWNDQSTEATLYVPRIGVMGRLVTLCEGAARAHRALFRGSLVLYGVVLVAAFFGWLPGFGVVMIAAALLLLTTLL